jgi:predicted TIM-barrel fold metal-dependent hydrolase
LLVEQLRGYCPRKHLEAFDEFVQSWEAAVEADDNVPPFLTDTFVAGVGVANLDTPGHYDMEVRCKEMDQDGVAAEVIFHASENGQPIPFRPTSGHFGHDLQEDPQLAAVGVHIYNQWLVDACSTQPERHAGLVHLPMWDVDAAVKELEWAREAGLRGVNFPAMRANYPPYNDRVWEPLWSAAEALAMPLTTHIGGGSPAPFHGVEAIPLKMFEDSHIFGYRAIHWLILAGVFERHPGLELVITEIAGDWFPHYLGLLDDIWHGGRKYPGFKEQVPRPASEYCMEHVYFGASFMAAFEAEAAVREGYVDRMMWGSDYPHVEGTWQNDFDYHGETATHLALRNTFAGVPEPALRQMAGETAIEVYGLDRVALGQVAARIKSPTPSDLATPPSELPKGLSTLAFRKHGTWT